MKHWPFTVINDASRPKVKVDYKGETKTFYPEEISSMVLLKMKEIAEAYLGKVLHCTKYNLEACIFKRFQPGTVCFFADCNKCCGDGARLLQ